MQRIMEGGLSGQDVAKDSNGIGLDNVMNRLEIYYDCDNLLRVFSEGEGKGTTIRISLPQRAKSVSNQ